MNIFIPSRIKELSEEIEEKYLLLSKLEGSIEVLKMEIKEKDILMSNFTCNRLHHLYLLDGEVVIDNLYTTANGRRFTTVRLNSNGYGLIKYGFDAVPVSELKFTINTKGLLC